MNPHRLEIEIENPGGSPVTSYVNVHVFCALKGRSSQVGKTDLHDRQQRGSYPHFTSQSCNEQNKTRGVRNLRRTRRNHLQRRKAKGKSNRKKKQLR